MSRVHQPVAAAVGLRSEELIRAELAAVEELLVANAASEVELLEAAARHILEAGGKRLRPQLLLLAARAMQYTGDRAVPLATAFELVHTATLVHDDIVDESDSRRGRGSLNYFWGNSASVLIGDYLVVQAFGLVVRDGDPRLVQILCETVGRMCEGEVMQLCYRGDTDVTIEKYRTICDYKTAVLTQCCTRTGAMLGVDSPSQAEALARFGHQIGMGFQIADDVLDLLGDEASLGKPIGGDIREGKVTLPTIYALQRARKKDREALLRLLNLARCLTGEDVQTMRDLIGRYDGFDSALELAWEYVRRAQDALTILPASPARDALWRLANGVVERDR